MSDSDWLAIVLVNSENDAAAHPERAEQLAAVQRRADELNAERDGRI